MIQIRQMEEKDIKAVTALEAACFHHPWPEEQIIYELHENPCSTILIAEEDGVFAGYLDFMITFDSATINRIAVYPIHRRKGIAFQLLERMTKICKSQEEPVSWITLEVRKSNSGAIALYESNGYERITIKPHYYDDGEDALYMVRSIIA